MVQGKDCGQEVRGEETLKTPELIFLPVDVMTK